MTFEQLITGFAGNMQVSLPPADEDGLFNLLFDGMSVSCFYAAGSVYFKSTVCSFPNEGGSSERLVLLKKLLQVALVNLNTTREVLCLDESCSDIVLFRQMNLSNLSSIALEQMLGQFINSLEYFKQYTTEDAGTVGATAMMIKP
jgi:Tir chaperone protein (CesT) family